MSLNKLMFVSWSCYWAIQKVWNVSYSFLRTDIGLFKKSENLPFFKDKKNDLYIESECRKSGTITIIAIAQVNLYGMFRGWH